MWRYFILLVTIIFSGNFLTKSASAQIIDSNFFEWTVYEIQTNELEPKICYMVSHPNESDSNHNSRQKPYIMITKFQETNSEEFSTFSGFNYKKNSEVFLTSDNIQFKIIAKENTAWPKTKYEDIKLIQTMLNSAFLNVRADSDISTYAIDKYSLKGITKAYARMKEICK